MSAETTRTPTPDHAALLARLERTAALLEAQTDDHHHRYDYCDECYTAMLSSVREAIAALTSPVTGEPGEITPADLDRLRSEHAEMLWGLQNVHMLARRAINAPNEAKCREKLPHIIRICEQQSPESLTSGVLRQEAATPPPEATNDAE